jgi:hypothetical protein
VGQATKLGVRRAEPVEGEANGSRSTIWIPAVVIALLAMPLIVTNRSFGHDWTLHLWLLRQQQLNIQSLSHPGLFVSAGSLGVFYPIFAFVGSGLYTVGGYLAILLGDRPILAYKLLYLAGFAMGYGGMTWLSRQLGIRGWRSQVPGLVLVTGAYFITDLAGRGDLGELLALAAIPLLIAAGRSVFSSSRIRARDLLTVVGAVFVLTGSHNITLMWGSVFVVLLAIVSFVAFAPVGLPPIPWPRLAALAGSGAIGAGLNAWFLFPDLRYGLDTNVAGQNQNKIPKTVLAKPGLLLNPLRPSDLTSSAFSRDIRLAAPWMFALWAVVVVALLWRNREGSSKRAFVGVFGIALFFIGIIVWHGVWKAFPHVLYNVQFTWRLNAYVLLTTALLVLLALGWQATAPERLKRSTTVVLVALLVFNLGAAIWQVWRVRSEYVRGGKELVTGSTFADQVVASRDDPPLSWYGKGDFRDFSAPPIETDRSRLLTIPSTAVHRSKFKGVLRVPDGPLPFDTNISAGPRFVRMTGIEPIGRAHDGSIVAVRRRQAPPTGPIEVTIVPIESNVLRLGALVSIISVVLLVGMVLWALGRLLRRRLRAR